MSGNPQAFNDMLHHMYHGGRVALLGILPGDTRIDWDQVIFKGLHLKGIYGREMFETWYKMTQMVLGGLDLAPVLTHISRSTSSRPALTSWPPVRAARWSAAGSEPRGGEHGLARAAGERDRADPAGFAVQGGARHRGPAGAPD